MAGSCDAEVVAKLVVQCCRNSFNAAFVDQSVKDGFLAEIEVIYAEFVGAGSDPSLASAWEQRVEATKTQ
jgi:hypothetical protein